MTGRWDSSGKLEAGIIKKINEMFSLRYLLYSKHYNRFSAYYLNSDPN